MDREDPKSLRCKSGTTYNNKTLYCNALSDSFNNTVQDKVGTGKFLNNTFERLPPPRFLLGSSEICEIWLPSCSSVRSFQHGGTNNGSVLLLTVNSHPLKINQVQTKPLPLIPVSTSEVWVSMNIQMWEGGKSELPVVTARMYCKYSANHISATQWRLYTYVQIIKTNVNIKMINRSNHSGGGK